MTPKKPRKPSIQNKDSWKKVSPASAPIFQTSVYNYPDLETLDDYYNGKIPDGYIYSRNGLPNAEALAKRVAELEETEKGIVCSSGMAALFVALGSNLKSGSRIVASSDLYGGTIVLLRDELPRFGIETLFADATAPETFENAVKTEAANVFLIETISNPTMKVCDVREIVKIAHGSGAEVIVDNTFATPFVLRPHHLGADIVMHSGTKSLGGHSDVTIGVLCGNNDLMTQASRFNTRIGAIAGPFDCWLATRSLSTWKIRTEVSCRNAMKLAKFLQDNTSKVASVNYPGLDSHPQYNLATELFTDEMYGSMLSFNLKGGFNEPNVFIKKLKKVTLTPSLGSVKTTISHPGKTSHRHLTEEQKRAAGITDSMIRVSVGIEDYNEIEADFKNALQKT